MPRRVARPATEGYLERVALHYLERYPGSEARVRRALAKRVRRSVEELGTDRSEGEAALESVIAKLRRLRLIDDARLARSRVATLRARGKSAAAIRAALRAQGIDASLADEALREADGELGAAAELEAARALVRRRRLGPHRPEAQRAQERQRDLGKLGRAGYSFDVARRALED